jgi:hypothetical protein
MTTATAALDLTTATPVEIDTELARLYDEHASIAARLDVAIDALHTYTGSTYTRGRFGRMYDRDTDQALAAADSGEGVKSHYRRRATEYAAKVRSLRVEIAANLDAQAPLHAEYRRRPWTRAFVVITSGKGHVHKSMECHTCYATTQFAWMPAFSGKDEAEIIEAAGSDACTICYPNAPVTTRERARSLWTKDEIARAEARIEREQAAAKRAAAKAAKAIGPLSVFKYRMEERVIYYGPDRGMTKPAHDVMEKIETVHAAKSWLTDSQEEWRVAKRPEDVRLVAEALAAKNGTTPQAEIEAARKRAAKRR